jgi:hypothetical protein
MPIWRILLTASVLEAAFLAASGAAASGALLALAGRVNGWFDLFAQPAPAWPLLGLLALVVSEGLLTVRRYRRPVRWMAAVAVAASLPLLVPEIAPHAMARRRGSHPSPTARRHRLAGGDL